MTEESHWFPLAAQQSSLPRPSRHHESLGSKTEPGLTKTPSSSLDESFIRFGQEDPELSQGSGSLVKFEMSVGKQKRAKTREWELKKK